MAKTPIPLSSERLAQLDVDWSDTRQVLIAINHDYLLYLQRLDELDETEFQHMERMEAYVGHLFETLSDDDFGLYGLHFQVFYGLKHRYRHMTDEQCRIVR